MYRYHSYCNNTMLGSERQQPISGPRAIAGNHNAFADTRTYAPLGYLP
ncbi:MAG: hypothetical protein ACM3PB_00010 [Betaproteobacteria bacterium]